MLSVLTFCSGYHYETFLRFAGSLNDTGFSGKLYFFFKQCDIANIDRIKERYENIEYFVCDIPANTTLCTHRYTLYLDRIQSGQIVGDHLLICDSRDVLFQKNPDNYAFDKNYDLFVFQEENILIGESEYNANWIKHVGDLVDDDIYGLIKDKPVFCSGTTVGTLEGISVYLNELKRYPNRNQLVGFDQGVHNYLIHCNKLDNLKIKILTHRDNFVNTVGHGYKKVNEHNLVVNKQHDVSFVVHQYDRMALADRKKISLKYDYTLY